MLTLDDLKRELRARPAEERAELAEMLLASLDDQQDADVEAAWAQEIAARIGTYERGEAEVFAAEDVFAEARRLAK
ncbi:addiction module protein [Pseudoduganella namucuonensis]|uniref:Putative addiction module component, TIGR02574 family n=1 Tax=Pseudoduganella namucuonensis TaxID=1035707 RepID=A0A1I7ETN4_9BURK|nr:addiction module protein [Pseudoduganella namucuonensis]SFU27242.1 putative addiction module component, TIGR02574 family [Pseudoduganella namucuonensis]